MSTLPHEPVATAPPQVTNLRQGPIVFVSNPNTGKTTLFNELTGLRHKTSNFPGTTLDIRRGVMQAGPDRFEVVDMPGLYSLIGGTSEENTAIQALRGELATNLSPACVVLVLDATNLIRNLFLAGQVLELGIPTVVALNMMDLADRAKIQIDHECLADHLGCPVVPVVARSGKGLPELRETCAEVMRGHIPMNPPKLLKNLPDAAESQVYAWAEGVAESCVTAPATVPNTRTERLDRFLTHPVSGTAAFAAILFAVFYLIFSLATLPMDLIDGAFADAGDFLAGVLPGGQFQSLVVDGIVAGVGGVLVFLPQICILFFCISILEDTGYLARAACVLDRFLRKVGLPGKAFVPMLSAHACAIPAIMSARIIEDKNDRLVTILVLPLMTCSARLPVYAMVTALLFPNSPLRGALVFTGAYGLGILAAMSMAFMFRRTLIRKATSPLILELPAYRVPSLKTALMAAYDRGLLFVRKAGTVILAISIVLWWLMSYPQQPETAEAVAQTAPAVTTASPEARSAQSALGYSFAGRLGHAIEPVIEPLGFDWKIGVGIVASFAAREVIVSALSVIYGVGEAGVDDESLLIDRLRAATRPDGTPVFGFATSVSLLVFYVLAMQCLPTQAVTRRETGTWGWAAFQFGYMTVLAYVTALVAYQGLTYFGVS